MIRTKNLTKRYGSVTAVDSLDLDIASGTVYGFLGPNGAGKTTTMHMLTGLTQPTEGDALLMGDSITNREDVLNYISFLPESPPLYPEFTAREQLDYAGEMNDVSKDQRSNRIESLLVRLDLDGSANERIRNYSKGMRQKTALIQALLSDPDVLFLDEPTSGLDPQTVRTFRKLIRELADDGVTVFLSTHILPVVDDVADEVGVIRNGRLVAEGTPTELKTQVEDDPESTLEDVFVDVTTPASPHD